MTPMLVAVDIGNTNIHLGLFEDEKLVKHLRQRADADLDNLSLEPSILKDTSNFVLASVNPRIEELFCQWLASKWGGKPLRIPKDIPLRMPILAENPERVGIDRLLNALAAFSRTQSATIVVDMGTAITVDAVSRRGEFLGGIIAPGLETFKEALHARTALLPKVSVTRPHLFLGKNTEAAINIGIYWGLVGIVEKLLKGLTKELGGRPKIIATGGDVELFVRDMPSIKSIVPHLTLEGIMRAYRASTYSV